jgi:hypothetical protein
MNLDLSIKTESQEQIEWSFERIAIDLLTNFSLIINDNSYCFTEIEFYYFLKGKHEDNSTHPHNYPEGNWRFHSQGLDITFRGTIDSDGGILIRGIKKLLLKDQDKIETKAINGPRRVLSEIFDSLGHIDVKEIAFGIEKKCKDHCEIYKTTRHGLTSSVSEEFKNKEYRYFRDLDHWDIKHVNADERKKIRSKSRLVKMLP